MNRFLVGNNIDPVILLMVSMIFIKIIDIYIYSMNLYRVSEIDQIESDVDEICKIVTVPDMILKKFYLCWA